MMGRELGDTDYETLLQLDNEASLAPSDLTEEVVRSLPTERVRKNGLLMAPGQQCRVCLQRYIEAQQVRRLPCRHKFHRECIDNWLLHQHATCPVDGTVFTNQSIRAYQEAEKIRQQQRRQAAGNAENTNGQAMEAKGGLCLEVPGVGISSRAVSGGRGGALRSGHLRGARAVVPDGLDILVSGTGYSGSSEPCVPPDSRHQAPINTFPLVPVVPSIPRVNAVLNLDIDNQRSGDSTHLPRTGPRRDRAGSAGSANGGRSRPGSRPTAHDSQSSSQPRPQEGVQSGAPLHVGTGDSPLLTSERRAHGAGAEASSGERRDSVASTTHVDVAMLRVGANNGRSEQTVGGSPSLPRALTRGRPSAQTGRQTVAHTGDSRPSGGADLCISGSRGGSGTNSTSSSPVSGSPVRLRHGRTSVVGPHEATNLRPAKSPASSSGLYVGADPASSESCLRQFLLNSIAHKNATKTSPKLVRHGSTREGRREEERRWGEVREMSGDSNTMVLSGNKVKRQDGS